MYQLIEYATDPNEDEPDENWSAKLGDGLVKLRDADHRLYSRSERTFVTEMVERAVAYRSYRPSLDSLLRVASIQAVGVVDLIRSPAERCSPRLFDVGRVTIGGHQRKTVHAGRWAEIKDVVEKALRSEEREWLPTKQALLRPYGLSPSGFWQHFPDLSAQYERERALRVATKWASDNQRAIATARRLVEKRLRRGQKVHVRTSGAVLMRALRISKATAESAMNVALGRRARPSPGVSVSAAR